MELLAVWRHNKPKTKNHCPSGVTGSEIHLILECPATSHVALPVDLIQFLTTLLYDTCQPDWSTLTTQQQTSLILGDPPSTLPKKVHHVWLQSTLPAILDCVSHLETFLYNLNNLSGINKGK